METAQIFRAILAHDLFFFGLTPREVERGIWREDDPDSLAELIKIFLAKCRVFGQFPRLGTDEETVALAKASWATVRQGLGNVGRYGPMAYGGHDADGWYGEEANLWWREATDWLLNSRRISRREWEQLVWADPDEEEWVRLLIEMAR